MSKNILFVLWMVFPIFSLGQSKLAKLKYEQAQELYGNKEYSLAIKKLDETQQILGSVNPRILYLRILTASKIVFAKIENETQLAAILKKDIAYYLSNYKEVESMTDEYEEVNKIANELRTIAGNDQLAQMEENNKKNEQSRAVNENDAFAKAQNYIEMLEDKYHYKQDILASDFIKINNDAAIMLQGKSTKSGGVIYYNAPIKVDQPFPVGPYAAWVDKDDRVVYYSVIIDAAKKNDQGIKAAFDKLSAEIKSNVSADFLPFENDDKKLTILKPTTNFVIETELLSVQKWQAISITFKHKTE